MSDASTSRFAILLDGTFCLTDRLHSQVAGCRAIAADGGIRHAEALQLEPELWVGDFDSSDGALDDRYRDIRRDPYPSEKSVSDGEIAISHALERGARELVLVGALGGERSDHAMFNLVSAAGFALRNPGIDILLTTGAEEALPLIPGKPLRPAWPDGTIFSVAGFTKLYGLTVKGAKWPLDQVELEFGSTWTLSNVALADVQIQLDEGCAVAMCRFDKPRNSV